MQKHVPNRKTCECDVCKSVPGRFAGLATFLDNDGSPLTDMERQTKAEASAKRVIETEERMDAADRAYMTDAAFDAKEEKLTPSTWPTSATMDYDAKNPLWDPYS